MLFLANTHYSTAYLARLTELLSDHGEQQVEPAVIQGAWILALRKKVSPLAPFCALCIFPFWFDPFLEEMEVSPHDQPTRRQNVVVEAPKIFYGIKSVDSSQCLSPCRLFLASAIIPQVVSPNGSGFRDDVCLPVRVVEPESPSVLQWMFQAEVWRGLIRHAQTLN